MIFQVVDPGLEVHGPVASSQLQVRGTVVVQFAEAVVQVPVEPSIPHIAVADLGGQPGQGLPVGNQLHRLFRHQRDIVAVEGATVEAGLLGAGIDGQHQVLVQPPAGVDADAFVHGAVFQIAVATKGTDGWVEDDLVVDLGPPESQGGVLTSLGPAGPGGVALAGLRINGGIERTQFIHIGNTHTALGAGEQGQVAGEGIANPALVHFAVLLLVLSFAAKGAFQLAGPGADGQFRSQADQVVQIPGPLALFQSPVTKTGLAVVVVFVQIQTQGPVVHCATGGVLTFQFGGDADALYHGFPHAAAGNVFKRLLLAAFAGFQGQRGVTAQGDAQARHQPVIVLFGIIEGSVGPLWVIAKLRVGATAGQAQFLVFAAGGEVGFDTFLLVAHIGEGAVIAHRVVVPVPVAVQGADGHSAAQVALLAGGIAAAAKGAIAAAIHFQPGAVFIAAAGDDIDHPAHGAIAVQGCTRARKDLDTLNGGQGNATEEGAGQINIREAATIEQDQGVLVGGGAKAQQVQAGLAAVNAKELTGLQAAHGIQHFCQVAGGHAGQGFPVQGQGAGGQLPGQAGMTGATDFYRLDFVISQGQAAGGNQAYGQKMSRLHRCSTNPEKCPLRWRKTASNSSADG